MYYIYIYIYVYISAPKGDPLPLPNSILVQLGGLIVVISRPNPIYFALTNSFYQIYLLCPSRFLLSNLMCSNKNIPEGDPLPLPNSVEIEGLLDLITKPD